MGFLGLRLGRGRRAVLLSDFFFLLGFGVKMSWSMREGGHCRWIGLVGRLGGSGCWALAAGCWACGASGGDSVFGEVKVRFIGFWEWSPGLCLSFFGGVGGEVVGRRGRLEGEGDGEGGSFCSG